MIKQEPEGPQSTVIPVNLNYRDVGFHSRGRQNLTNLRE